MIKPYDFKNAIYQLEAIYGQMDGNKLDVYYDLFKNRDLFILKRAVGYLVKTYKFKSMPLPADFEEAYDFCAKLMPIQRPANDCPYCCDGWVLKPHKDEPWKSMGYVIAVCCTCVDGKIKEAACKKADQHRRRQRTKGIAKLLTQ